MQHSARSLAVLRSKLQGMLMFRDQGSSDKVWE